MKVRRDTAIPVYVTACNRCGQGTKMNLIVWHKNKRRLCEECEKIERGIYRQCSLCGLGVESLHAYRVHMRSPETGSVNAHRECYAQEKKQIAEEKAKLRDVMRQRIAAEDKAKRDAFLKNKKEANKDSHQRIAELLTMFEAQEAARTDHPQTPEPSSETSRDPFEPF